MLPKSLIYFALFLSVIGAATAEEVEVTGTFEIQIGCEKNHHEITPMVVVKDKDGFISTALALKIDAETTKKFHVGQPISVKGKKHKATKQKMTKAQVRKAMVEHTQHGEGLPLYCKGIGDIISKIQTDKSEQKATDGHDHGKLQLMPVDDDQEVVEVHIMEHIEVTSIEAKK